MLSVYPGLGAGEADSPETSAESDFFKGPKKSQLSFAKAITKRQSQKTETFLTMTSLCQANIMKNTHKH